MLVIQVAMSCFSWISLGRLFLNWTFNGAAGKIDGIIGSPPGRSGVPVELSEAKGAEVRALSLTARMLWLQAVSQMGRMCSAGSPDRMQPVVFVMDHPTSPRVSKGSDPGTRASMWETAMWRLFQKEMGMKVLQFDQAATSLGTNVYYLGGLHGLGIAHHKLRQGRHRCGPPDW